MGRFKIFMAESDQPWRDDLDLRYVHDHMGVDFLKLLVQYEDGGKDAVTTGLWNDAVNMMYDRLVRARETDGMEYDEAMGYAAKQLDDALGDYVARTD